MRRHVPYLLHYLPRLLTMQSTRRSTAAALELQEGRSKKSTGARARRTARRYALLIVLRPCTAWWWPPGPAVCGPCAPLLPECAALLADGCVSSYASLRNEGHTLLGGGNPFAVSIPRMKRTGAHIHTRGPPAGLVFACAKGPLEPPLFSIPR